ncbi:hypothetical protein BDZ91DRAFT_766651 [Kalaharituber pfeilii]|nr:hypothetical protein BDZ91DRAFT_766651 [Kalaharituber pfeilii]
MSQSTEAMLCYANAMRCSAGRGNTIDRIGTRRMELWCRQGAGSQKSERKRESNQKNKIITSCKSLHDEKKERKNLQESCRNGGGIERRAKFPERLVVGWKGRARENWDWEFGESRRSCTFGRQAAVSWLDVLPGSACVGECFVDHWFGRAGASIQSIAWGERADCMQYAVGICLLYYIYEKATGVESAVRIWVVGWGGGSRCPTVDERWVWEGFYAMDVEGMHDEWVSLGLDRDPRQNVDWMYDGEGKGGKEAPTTGEKLEMWIGRVNARGRVGGYGRYHKLDGDAG